MLVRCLYGSGLPARPAGADDAELRQPRKSPRPTRQAALKLPLTPSVTKDSEIDGFRLIVTTVARLLGQFLQPRGLDPDGRRWRVVRHELGDARTMTVCRGPQLPRWRPRRPSGRAETPTAKDWPPGPPLWLSVRSFPTTAGEAAALYAQTARGARAPVRRTKRKTIHYVGKAIRLMGGDAIALAAIDTRAVRLMIDAVDSSAFERHHVFGALDRFLAWCVKRELIPLNPCAGIDRDDRPRPGRSRDHTPPIATIRRAWDAVEDAPDHVRALIRFLLLVPLRREEGAGPALVGGQPRREAHHHSRRADERPATAQPAAVGAGARHSCRARVMPRGGRSRVCAAVRRPEPSTGTIG